MPSARARRVMLVATVVGLLLACNGLVQIVSASNMAALGPARLWLLAAAVILTPLFIYMTGVRRRGRRAARASALERKAGLDAEAEYLRTPEGVRAAGREPAAPE